MTDPITQCISVRNYNDQSDGPPRTMLNWPAGHELPRGGDTLVYFNSTGARFEGTVTHLSHEHRHIPASKHEIGGTPVTIAVPDVTTTVWVQFK